MLENLLLFFVGICVGVINTIAGGGSLLTLPMFIFLGLPPSVANGTNRVAIVIQSAIAAIGFKSKNVSTFPFNIYLAMSAVVGSIIGAKIALDIKGEIFNKILSIIMIVVLLIIVLKPKIKAEQFAERITGKYLYIGIIAFFFVGIYGGFINAGIGFIIILFLSSVNRMSLVRANATKVVITLIYSISALVIFVLDDKVNWKAGLILAFGNGIGAWVSSRFSVDKGDAFVKKFLIAMIIVMAIKLWFF